MHIVAGAVLVRDGRALLAHRSPGRRWYPDVWDVVGGHVDVGESRQTALVRELHEELGVTVDADFGEPLVHIVDPDAPGGGLDIVIWVVTAWTGEIANRAPDEHDALRWFARDELPGLALAHPRLPALLGAVLPDDTLPDVVVVESVAWDDAGAVALRDALRAEMRVRYADRRDTREGIAADMTVPAEAVVYTGVAYVGAGEADRVPVGHVALRRHGDDGTEVELKRMFVSPSHRGRGVSHALLAAVEQAAVHLGARRIVLQTGDRQPDAVHVYESHGYTRIPIFAPYEALTYSHCFAKPTRPGPDMTAQEQSP